MSDKAKRPPKSSTINFILSQYACLKAGIPGITMETVKAQIEYGNYYLYRKEVEALVEKQAEQDPNFDVELFVNILTNADAVKETAAPKFGSGEGVTRINSKERALEVANNPADEEEVTKIVELMTKIIELRKEVDTLISKKGSVSVAIKNKKNKKKKEPKESKVEAEVGEDL